MSIKITDLIYTYQKNSIFEYQALDGINLEIESGSFCAIVGQTGSGKSSLIQHLNAILIPSSGQVQVNDFIIDNQSAKKSFKDLRAQVGLVFQFSEYQLFEETILKDVMFGPLNFDATEQEAKQLAYDALKLVGIDESLFDKSPFNLSGGQKRRVAIAGILAMDPNIIVLDEPTAGLDPQGAIEIMDIFLELSLKHNKTLILVSHDMDFVYQYANEVILLNKGKVIFKKEVVEFFNDEDISKYSIVKPSILSVYENITKQKTTSKINFDDLISAIKGAISNVE